MNHLRLVAFSLVLGCVAACTAPAPKTAASIDGADTPRAELAQAAVDAPKVDDPVICESSAPTGSRIARKTCKRQSVIEQEKRDARDATDAAQRSGVQNGNPTKG